MKKPNIIMSARENEIREYSLRLYSNIDSYDHYILKAGGLPFTFRAASEEDAAMAAESFDGLLLTGGMDVNPSFYGEENHGSFPGDEEIDESDIFLYNAFKAAGKPVLAICRGLQVVAAAEGCRLIQDIPACGIYRNHNQRNETPPVPNNHYYHSCICKTGTRMHEIMGDACMVNSFHHQASTAVPEGFRLSAVSPDGIIEAFEKDNIIAVQWHPERLMADENHLKIAEMFIEDCLSCKAG